MRWVPLVLVLVGCVTPGPSQGPTAYEQWVANSVGFKIDGMILELGPPTRSMQLRSDSAIYEWYREGDTQVRAASGYAFGTVYTKGSEVHYWCRTTLITGKDDTIISWRIEGNPNPRVACH